MISGEAEVYEAFIAFLSHCKWDIYNDKRKNRSRFFRGIKTVVI